MAPELAISWHGTKAFHVLTLLIPGFQPEHPASSTKESDPEKRPSASWQHDLCSLSLSLGGVPGVNLQERKYMCKAEPGIVAWQMHVQAATDLLLTGLKKVPVTNRSI